MASPAVTPSTGGWCSCGPNAECDEEDDFTQFECDCKQRDHVYRNGVCVHEDAAGPEPREESCAGVDCGPNARCKASDEDTFECECNKGYRYSSPNGGLPALGSVCLPYKDD